MPGTLPLGARSFAGIAAAVASFPFLAYLRLLPIQGEIEGKRGRGLLVRLQASPPLRQLICPYLLYYVSPRTRNRPLWLGSEVGWQNKKGIKVGRRGRCLEEVGVSAGRERAARIKVGDCSACSLALQAEQGSKGGRSHPCPTAVPATDLLRHNPLLPAGWDRRQGRRCDPIRSRWRAPKFPSLRRRSTRAAFLGRLRRWRRRRELAPLLGGVPIPGARSVGIAALMCAPFPTSLPLSRGQILPHPRST